MSKEEENKLTLKAMASKGNLLAPAMFPNHIFLDEKLKSIWMLAAELANYAEKNHDKLITKFWVNSIPDPTSLLLKALNRPEHVPESEHSLLRTYRSLLFTASEIHEWTVLCLYNKKPIKLTHPTGNAEFISSILTSKNLQSQPFLNYVVPHFFPLQLNCYHLHKLLGSPRGIPMDPDDRRTRASNGGKARVIGEDILKSRFSDFLESKAGSTLPSGKAFFHKFSDELKFILQAYLNNDVGKTKHPQSQRIITYDGGLTPEGLVKKFGGWKKTDPIFKDRWERLVPPKEKAS